MNNPWYLYNATYKVGKSLFSNLGSLRNFQLALQPGHVIYHYTPYSYYLRKPSLAGATVWTDANDAPGFWTGKGPSSEGTLGLYCSDQYTKQLLPELEGALVSQTGAKTIAYSKFTKDQPIKFGQAEVGELRSMYPLGVSSPVSGWDLTLREDQQNILLQNVFDTIRAKFPGALAPGDTLGSLYYSNAHFRLALGNSALEASPFIMTTSVADKKSAIIVFRCEPNTPVGCVRPLLRSTLLPQGEIVFTIADMIFNARFQRGGEADLFSSLDIPSRQLQLLSLKDAALRIVNGVVVQFDQALDNQVPTQVMEGFGKEIESVRDQIAACNVTSLRDVMKMHNAIDELNSRLSVTLGEFSNQPDLETLREVKAVTVQVRAITDPLRTAGEDAPAADPAELDEPITDPDIEIFPKEL